MSVKTDLDVDRSVLLGKDMATYPFDADNWRTRAHSMCER
ncbi:hypothetical protein ACVWWJ_000417 [Luteibacter sp. HA06]